MVGSCMAAKGYTLVKKNALPSVTAAAKTGQPYTAKPIAPEMESKLIGIWESQSLKVIIAAESQGQFDKQRFVFFSNQRLLLETLFKNGKSDLRLVHYSVDGDNIVMIDPFLSNNHQNKKTSARFSLIDNQMIITTYNSQLILNKLQETNSISPYESLLLGKWVVKYNENQTTSFKRIRFNPANRYSLQTGIKSPNRNSETNEDGIYYYDMDNLVIVVWSDKDAQPEMYKCSIINGKLNVIIGNSVDIYSRESELILK